MSRVIKFRAWGNNSKEMMTWDKLRPNLSLAFEQANRGALELMQFTGLYDKNGKEIYEGDVVRLHCSPNPDHALEAVIEWRGDGTAKFVPNIIHKMVWNEHRKKEVSAGEMHSYVGLHSCFSFPCYMEVIGNIYEHPHLLSV